MSFPQLGYQYIRPIYPPERQGIAGNARSGTELSPSGALSNVLSTMYGSPFAAAAQGYGAFLPYSNDISIFNQLVSHSPPFKTTPNFCIVVWEIEAITTGLSVIQLLQRTANFAFKKQKKKRFKVVKVKHINEMFGFIVNI